MCIIAAAQGDKSAGQDANIPARGGRTHAELLPWTAATHSSATTHQVFQVLFRNLSELYSQYRIIKHLSIVLYSTATGDPVIQALQGFAGLKDMEKSEKIEFLKGVTPQTIDQLPKVTMHTTIKTFIHCTL